MSAVLFLFGILIKKIQLNETYTSSQNKSAISFNIRCSDILNVDIVLEDLLTDLEKTEVLEEPGEIEINMGKTYLFTSSHKELMSELRKNPLEISLCIMRKTEGTIFYKWNQEFINFLKRIESSGQIRSFQLPMNEEFLNENAKVIGSCDCVLLVSCYGSNIQHDFCIDIEGDSDIYINNFNKKTFQCYNFEKLLSAKSEMPLFTISWPSIFGKDDVISFRGLDDEETIYDFNMNMLVEDVHSISESEIPDLVSLCYRPPEKKYYDLAGLISADVTTTNRGTHVTLTMGKQPRTATPSVREKRIDEPALTIEDKLNEKLCKGKDCPAAVKLKEFGLGPLATSRNLGALYGDVKPSISYGLSQTYGTFSRYGPYGILVDDQSPDNCKFSTEISTDGDSPEVT